MPVLRDLLIDIFSFFFSFSQLICRGHSQPVYFSYLDDLRQHLRVAHGLNNRFKLVIGWFETYYGSRQYILKRGQPLLTDDGFNDELTALGDLSLVDPLIIRRTLNRMIQKGICFRILSV